MDDVSISFIELVALTRITPESTVEKFGSLINSSFFDASNILATLKQKGLVDFVTAFPSQSTLKITDKGSELLADVTKRSTEPVDQLDIAILTQLSNGRRGLADLGGALNVAQKDLAVHIYKLAAQQDLTYELVNAVVSMYLSEKGFVAVKSQAQQMPQQQAAAAPAPMANGAEQPQVAVQKTVEDEMKVLEEISKKRRATKKIMMLGIVALIAAVFLVIVLMEFKVA